MKHNIPRKKKKTKGKHTEKNKEKTGKLVRLQRYRLGSSFVLESRQSSMFPSKNATTLLNRTTRQISLKP